MLIHPGGREGHEREPEEQVQVGPQHSPSHPVNKLEQVVVVVPVDAQVHEAQQVGQQPRRRLGQGVERWLVRHAQLQHHDRDDDREYGVAEGLQPAGCHARESTKSAAVDPTDRLDTDTGELQRGRIAPADRAHLADWLGLPGRGPRRGASGVRGVHRLALCHRCAGVRMRPARLSRALRAGHAFAHCQETNLRLPCLCTYSIAGSVREIANPATTREPEAAQR